MEAELGEMDAEGRSERPPYAPGKKKKEEGKIELEKLLFGRIGLLGPTSPPARLPWGHWWSAG